MMNATNQSRPYRGLLVGLVLLAVVLPFIGLSFYNHPSLDDYQDAIKVKDLGFWQAQHYYYVTLTGRYTTTALLALINPLLYWRLEGQWWVVTVGFILGTLFILRYGLWKIVNLDGTKAWIGAGVLLSFWLAYAPGQAEGLYWFTGAYTYTATTWLVILWLAALASYAQAGQSGANTRLRLLLLAALTIAVAGTTEPVALPFLAMLLLGAGLSGWLGKGRALWLLAGLALAGCLVSFVAPGNSVRMNHMGVQFGLVKTLAYSAATTAYLLLTWVGNPVLLAVSALLLPTLHRMGQRQDQLPTRYLSRVPAGLVAGLLVLLLLAANCPAYYASGTGIPLRARNMLYLLFLLGWFGVVLVWCCRQARLPERSTIYKGLIDGRLAPLWAGLAVLFFFADYNVQTRAKMLGQGSNNAVRAYRQWLGGEAAGYDAELRARYRALAVGGPVMTLQPLRNRPELLLSFDVADIEDKEILGAYARYFGKQQVVTRSQNPVPQTDPKPILQK